MAYLGNFSSSGTQAGAPGSGRFTITPVRGRQLFLEPISMLRKGEEYLRHD